MDEVQTRGRGSRESQDPHTQAVLPAILDLLDQAALLECGDQSACGGLMHSQRGRELRDPGRSVLCEELENGDRTIDRLHGAGLVACCAWRDTTAPGVAVDIFPAFVGPGVSCGYGLPRSSPWLGA